MWIILGDLANILIMSIISNNLYFDYPETASKSAFICISEIVNVKLLLRILRISSTPLPRNSERLSLL